METRFREIEVAGTPLEMGRQIGEAAREEIRGFAAIALERVNKTIPVSRANAMAACRDSIPFVEGYAPDLLEELKGMSAGSGVALEEMMLLQMRNQLRPDEDAGCTSFSIAPENSAASGSMVGQNWDNDPAMAPLSAVITRKGDGKAQFTSWMQPGTVAYAPLR